MIKHNARLSGEQRNTMLLHTTQITKFTAKHKCHALRIRLEAFVSWQTQCADFTLFLTLQTPKIMCFAVLNSGAVSKQLINETTWNNPRRRKRHFSEHFGF
ncbi:hypothetical protein P3383_22420 [Vibrio parahaemolyticus]|nr:hypothetical protein [Vibrio parahaemolyticus]